MTNRGVAVSDVDGRRLGVVLVDSENDDHTLLVGEAHRDGDTLTVRWDPGRRLTGLIHNPAAASRRAHADANIADMVKAIGSEAQRPNPALAPLAPLVGQWRTTGTHPLVPETTFHGRTSFEWHEQGAFLMMRSEIDEPEVPSGIAIIGSDDAAGTLTMLYFDERDISRRYTVEVADGEVAWHRDEAGFAQGMVLTIAADGNRLEAKGTMSRDGGPWEDDLQLTYERITA